MDFVHNKIFKLRDTQIMLDSDLALLYQTETKFINRAVKRNLLRFPDSFAFQVNEEEWNSLRCQIGTLKDTNARGQHRKYLPWVFTEQGVAMLSSVLNTENAIHVSVQIIKAFVAMRKFIGNNASVFERLENLELKQMSTDKKMNQIFNFIESGVVKPTQGVFFDGQIFDAYIFVSDLVKSAKKI
jgi:phage regulator Rha-like protein